MEQDLSHGGRARSRELAAQSTCPSNTNRQQFSFSCTRKGGKESARIMATGGPRARAEATPRQELARCRLGHHSRRRRRPPAAAQREQRRRKGAETRAHRQPTAESSKQETRPTDLAGTSAELKRRASKSERERVAGAGDGDGDGDGLTGYDHRPPRSLAEGRGETNGRSDPIPIER
jgi:hypothetical protein